ncbi:ribosomal protein S18-alanine N-acetyltransferase [Persephonella sp.]
MITIREFQDDDITAVREIIKENFSHPWSDSLILSENPFSYKTVAVLDGEVIGFLFGEIIYTEGNINLIVVKKEFQRSGIGSVLLENFLNECMDSNVDTVFLEVSDKNSKAIKFYEKFGFSVIHIRKGYYKDGSNGLIMRLYL